MRIQLDYRLAQEMELRAHIYETFLLYGKVSAELFDTHSFLAKAAPLGEKFGFFTA